ncbi:hypothetical protein [uncultured Clostridium sp.]|uniref:hypothetical protein n=1 Tax=uncultured Clostridium sp. TaxID=59620 RepID=UPI002626F8C5|nr:hypothetical protein [uncultured Clostridium sp.]
MFVKIIDLNHSEAFIISQDDIITAIPLSYINGAKIGEQIFIPSCIKTSCHSYITTNNLI